MKKLVNGFTLVELLVAIAILGILMAIASPSFSQWRKNAQYKEAARQLAGAMMEAKSRAIAQNLEHELAFDLGGNKYMLRQGNRASNTRAYSTNPGDWTVLYSNREFSNPIDIKAIKNVCSENSANNFRFQFYPNGTVKINGSEEINNDGYICVFDNVTGTRKFQVGIASVSTGRVVVEK